jgi:hypothetical protein
MSGLICLHKNIKNIIKNVRSSGPPFIQLVILFLGNDTGYYGLSVSISLIYFLIDN